MCRGRGEHVDARVRPEVVVCADGLGNGFGRQSGVRDVLDFLLLLLLISSPWSLKRSNRTSLPIPIPCSRMNGPIMWESFLVPIRFWLSRIWEIVSRCCAYCKLFQ